MLTTHRTGDLRRVSARLHTEFSALPQRSVERCVTDTFKCAQHLGYDATPSLVERLAREHLQAIVKSEPPSTTRPRHQTGLR